MFAIALALFVSVASAALCSNPQVSPATYSSKDSSLVSETAFAATFSIKCNGQTVKGEPLFAVVGNEQVVIANDGENYQVSWVAKNADTSSADYQVRVYDAEGFAALRKAERKGEDVNPAFRVVISHKAIGGSFFPVSSEFLVLLAIGFVFFNAYNAIRSF